MANQDLTYQEKLEIKELSKQFLGSASRWQKLVEKGGSYPLIDAEGKNVVTEGGLVVSQLRRADARELLENLRTAKSKYEAAMEARRKEQESLRAAQQASGSVGSSG